METQLEDGFHLIFLIIKNYMRVIDGNKLSFVFSFADDEATFFFFHRVNLILHFIHRNGDGFVDREEFGDILHMTGENVTEEDIDEMFGESDTNKDGKIDFDGKMRLHVEGGFSSVLWTTHAVSSIISVELSGAKNHRQDFQIY